MKKILSTVLVIFMLFTIIPLNDITASAAEVIGDFEYYYWGSKEYCTISGYRGTASELVIPSQLDGCQVKSISEAAFNGCTSLTSVIIPDGVETIGRWAFNNCTSLTSITIPDGVTSIDDYAFSGCTALANIKISDSVIGINSGAFQGTAYYKTESNWENDVLYIGNHLIKAKNTLSGEYSIKEGTKAIACEAFGECTSLTSVTLPDGVTNIDDYAFEHCYSLTSITLPDSVINIGEHAFQTCYSLTSITIPDSITNIGYSAFSNCHSLASIIIPSSITNIYLATFANCWSLTNVTIPDSVTSIGENAFEHCYSLTSITIPNSVTNIGEGAFNGCDKLIIYGYSGSCAENHANENSIPFTAMDALTDSENNITIIFPDKDVRESDISLNVNKVSANENAVTYDIELIENGVVIQPESKVTVKIPVPANMNGADCKAYRAELDGTYTDMQAVYQDSYMVFTTDHFSVYVLTTENLNGLLGDVNDDEIVDAADAVMIQRYDAGLAKLTAEQLSVADVNCDGIVDAADAVKIQRYDAGLIDSL